MKNNQMNIIDRVQAPTPKWFKVLRTIGITLVSIGGAVLASPVALPAGIVSVAGYLILGGSIVTAVAHTGVKTDAEPKMDPEAKVE